MRDGTIIVKALWILNFQDLRDEREFYCFWHMNLEKKSKIQSNISNSIMLHITLKKSKEKLSGTRSPPIDCILNNNVGDDEGVYRQDTLTVK